MTQNPQAMPDAQGFFGPYGGQLVLHTHGAPLPTLRPSCEPRRKR